MLIDVVIPNFNGKRFLQTCLNSLQKQVGVEEFTIIVVDNGSQDGSVQFLEEQFPYVNIIALSKNMGFSTAVNVGIRSGSAPYVFLLNNDTEVDEHCLKELLKAVDSQPESDFFATKMLSFDERGVLDGAGDGFLRGGVGYRLGTMENDNFLYSRDRHVFGACAGAALYRRSLLEEIGMFDEKFFAYLEDVDLNLRAQCRGRKCWYVASARVYHIGSATSGSKINSFTVRLSTKNNLNILLKNYPLSLLIRFTGAILVYQFFWFCFVVKKHQIRAFSYGMIDFFSDFQAMLHQRRQNLESMTIEIQELALIMGQAEKEVIYSIMNRRKERGQSNFFFSLYMRTFLRKF